MKTLRTWNQRIVNSSLFHLLKESGEVYGMLLDYANTTNKETGKYPTLKELDLFSGTITTQYLYSQSVDGVYQQLNNNIKGYFKALEDFKINPKDYTGQPRPPHKKPFFFCVRFKEQGIRLKNNHILLTLKRPNLPVKIKWNERLGKPQEVLITWSHEFRGFDLYLILERDIVKLELDYSKTVAIDLGVKMIAATFDGRNVITFSGKYLKSLSRLLNKVMAKTASNVSKLTKGSRRYKKIKRAEGKVKRRIKRKQKDVLHKTSRTIVNHLVESKTGNVVIGDCAGIHQNTDTNSNQIIQQNLEQELRKQIQYKFESVGGRVKLVPEYSTSETCPECMTINSKPRNKKYKCKSCSFKYDGDGIGAINIYKVSFESFKVPFSELKRLNVVGGLTPPRGWKYHPQLSCKV